jgi:flagellar motility protein MotE (MotC chaperone)
MPRLLPLLFFLLLITLTVRIGDVLVTAVTGGHSESYRSEAQAEDKEEASAAGKKTAEKVESAEKPKEDGKTVVKDSTKDKVLKEDDESGDPFAPAFSDEELNVLQSLSQRREKLDQRERDLDQREKLMQAAEKKVDQKVVELNTLKGQMEKLLGKQQQEQDGNTQQLVKIYESMKPKDAATIFNDMQGDILLRIIGTMSERKSALILAAMDPVKARDISAQIAEQKMLPKGDNKAAPPQ